MGPFFWWEADSIFQGFGVTPEGEFGVSSCNIILSPYPGLRKGFFLVASRNMDTGPPFLFCVFPIGMANLHLRVHSGSWGSKVSRFFFGGGEPQGC